MREMLRMQKRSVQATYNTQISIMSAQMLPAAGNAEEKLPVPDSMQMLDAEAGKHPQQTMITKASARAGSNIMFVRSETQPPTSEETANVNPDEIDIDQDDDDDEEEPQSKRSKFENMCLVV